MLRPRQSRTGAGIRAQAQAKEFCEEMDGSRATGRLPRVAQKVIVRVLRMEEVRSKSLGKKGGVVNGLSPIPS